MNQSQERVGIEPSLDSSLGWLPEETVVPFRQKQDFSFTSIDQAVTGLADLPAHSWGKQPADFWDLVHEEDRAWLKKRLDAWPESTAWLATRFRIRHQKRGSTCHLLEFRRRVAESPKQPKTFEGFWLDQTWSVRIARRLASATGKETLALLASGYAHDLNNVLAGVGSLAELCLLEMQAAHPLLKNVAMIKENAQRASQLIESLSRLLYPNRPQPLYHNLSDLARESIRLLRPALPRRIQLSGKWAKSPLPVYIDEQDFRQALFHLAFNAAAATKGAGQIILQTSRRTKFKPGSVVAGVPPKGASACLAVMDSGRGMELERGGPPFDLCYSTRVGSAGIGFGLAHVYQFVLTHQGAVTVESVPGQGSAFRLWLPLANFQEEETCPVQTPAQILLAGETAPLLETLTAQLRSAGWGVVRSMENPELLLASGEESFAAAVLFVGPDVARTRSFMEMVRQQRVALKIILVTGPQGKSGLEPFLDQVELILESKHGSDMLLGQILAWFERTEAD